MLFRISNMRRNRDLIISINGVPQFSIQTLSHHTYPKISIYYLFLCQNARGVAERVEVVLKELKTEIAHYENTPIQIYRKFYLQKLKKKIG